VLSTFNASPIALRSARALSATTKDFLRSRNAQQPRLNPPRETVSVQFVGGVKRWVHHYQTVTTSDRPPPLPAVASHDLAEGPAPCGPATAGLAIL
jgi:hypothetical protein